MCDGTQASYSSGSETSFDRTQNLLHANTSDLRFNAVGVAHILSIKLNENDDNKLKSRDTLLFHAFNDPILQFSVDMCSTPGRNQLCQSVSQYGEGLRGAWILENESNFDHLSRNSTCCVSSRHVMTRYLAHAFWHRKKAYLLCRACCTASADTARRDERDKRDTSVTTSATGAIRNLVCL